MTTRDACVGCRGSARSTPPPSAPSWATWPASPASIRWSPTPDWSLACAGCPLGGGAFVGQAKLSKRGPGALRHALYLATVVAVRCRAAWRTRYQRLLDRGRAKKEALTILSRALLKVLYQLLRTGATYDAARLARG